MNSHTEPGQPTVPQMQDDLIRRMTPARRLEVARELHDTAWNLKMAVVKREHPEWPDDEVFAKVRRVFLTGYAGA